MSNQYRIRRKSDGYFLSSPKWGNTHAQTGKFYKTKRIALAAFKMSILITRKTEEARQNAMAAHELVEYEMREVAATPITSAASGKSQENPTA